MIDQVFGVRFQVLTIPSKEVLKEALIDARRNILLFLIAWKLRATCLKQ